MSALLLAIKKLIAVLTAFFIPTATAAPAIVPQHSRTVTVSIFDTVKDEQLEPAAEWDVSATENDNVTMSFYDIEDTESVFEQLAGRVTALFAPMTAYADTKVDFTEVPDEGGNGEFGNINPRTDEYAPIKGKVVVSGTGEMIDSVYNMFVDPSRYLNATVELFAEEGKTVTCEYKGLTDINEIAAAVTDIIELDANVVWKDAATDEIAYITDSMREALNPVNFLKYSPIEIEIKEGVTNVSDFAFALCGNITKVTIPEGVTSIGEYAFAYCDALTTVEFPSTLETIGYQAFGYTALESVIIPENVKTIAPYTFFNCRNLTNVVLPEGLERIEMNAFSNTALDKIVVPESVTYIDSAAFADIADGATIVIPNDDARYDFGRYNSYNYNIIAADAEVAA